MNSDDIKKYRAILSESVNGVNTFDVKLTLSIADLVTPEEVAGFITDLFEKNFQEEGEEVDVTGVSPRTHIGNRRIPGTHV